MSTTLPTSPALGHATDTVAEGSAHDLLIHDDELRRQLETLARDNQTLLASLGLTSTGHETTSGREPGSLETENQCLRERVAELEAQLAARATPDAWAEQQKEYEALLEEKSEVIRALHQKIQELREGGGGSVAGEDPPQRSELEELRAQLEAEREQLRQDEESVMQQMTQMEMTMSRERAEMARQRNELQRLHTDIRHELDVASRDPSLRERLATFHRRHQEVSGRKGSAAVTEANPEPGQSPPSSSDTPLPKKNPGLLRRFFG